MSHLVIDASVAVKWYVQEVHSDAARRVLEQRHRIFVPDLLLTEFSSILWKKVRRGDLVVEDAWVMLRSFQGVPKSLRSSARLIPLAQEIAFESGRSVYDSLYIACAMQWEIPMVTADERLYNATRNGPLTRHIVWVADPLDSVD